MRNIKSQIQKLTNPVIRKNGFITAQIIYDWPLIVGEYLSKYTTPIKVAFPAKKNIDGVLHIEVISAQAPLIQQIETEIISKVASYSGFKAISRIKLIHANKLPKDVPRENPIILTEKNSAALDKMLDGIEDGELKQHLKKIGQHIYKEKP